MKFVMFLSKRAPDLFFTISINSNLLLSGAEITSESFLFILSQFVSTSSWLYLQNKTKSQDISTATFLIQASIPHLNYQNSLLTGHPASIVAFPTICSSLQSNPYHM